MLFCVHFEKKQQLFPSNYRHISLNNKSKVFESVVQRLMSHYFTLPNTVLKNMKLTSTNLVTYFDFISPLVSSQRQADSIYFDLSSAFDYVPHSVLLHNLCAYGLSDSYANWFCS
jgi:hypothetical protein